MTQAEKDQSLFHWSHVIGEFRLGRDFLRSKPDASPWLVAKVADSILRGVAQVGSSFMWASLLPAKKGE